MEFDAFPDSKDIGSAAVTDEPVFLARHFFCKQRDHFFCRKTLKFNQGIVHIHDNLTRCSIIRPVRIEAVNCAVFCIDYSIRILNLFSRWFHLFLYFQLYRWFHGRLRPLTCVKERKHAEEKHKTQNRYEDLFLHY
ncbi:hypothetical protein ES703_59940 [subsurface metagenome]